MRKKRVAIVGTNGIPAKYGGFETLAENLTHQLNDKFEFTVYCSKKQKTGLKIYNNSKLITLPLSANGWQAIFYDSISLLHAWFTSDVILVLGPSAGFFLSLNKIFRKKILVNHGGLNEWERKKYSKLQSRISYFNHKNAAKYSFHSIVDNSLLSNSLLKNFNKQSTIIRYGGDHVVKQTITDKDVQKYSFLKNPYAVSVSRAQVDNNLHVLLKAFETIDEIPLVLIANWNVSDYGISLKEKYLKKNIKNIILLDAIYDQRILNLIRGNASVYIHSHSQCGTAPSLVEAMSLGLPVISFDVPTNRETTQNHALYFTDEKDIRKIIKQLNQKTLVELGERMSNIATAEYTWESIAKQYENLF